MGTHHYDKLSRASSDWLILKLYQLLHITNINTENNIGNQMILPISSSVIKGFTKYSNQLKRNSDKVAIHVVLLTIQSWRTILSCVSWCKWMICFIMLVLLSQQTFIKYQLSKSSGKLYRKKQKYFYIYNYTLPWKSKSRIYYAKHRDILPLYSIFLLKIN